MTKTSFKDSLTSVLMQIFREKSLSGRAATRGRGYRSVGGGRGQVQRRRGFGLGGRPRRTAQQPRRLRRLHHRGRRRRRGGRRAGRTREIKRLHLALNFHLGWILRESLHSRAGNVKPLTGSLSRRCKKNHQ